MQDDRHELLRAAGRFLVGVDEAFAQASGRNRDVKIEDAPERVALAQLLLVDTASQGWYVAWSDGVLDMFKRRVIGLGERDPHNLLDSHSPVDHERELNEYWLWRAAEQDAAAMKK